MIARALLALVSILIIVLASLYQARTEGFATGAFLQRMKGRQEEDPSAPRTSLLASNPDMIEYISCVAFDSKEIKDLLGDAPFWSMFLTRGSQEDIVSGVLPSIKRLSMSGKNKGVIKGPAYMLVGRNKDTSSVEAWVYIPSMAKNGRPIDNPTMRLYHRWLRTLLFSNMYAVSDWLCNNPCDVDPVQQKKKTYLPSNPECGCVSKNACSFYNLPRKFKQGKRDLKGISTYSIYRLKAPFFEAAGARLDKPDNLIINQIDNGAVMYEGCDTRLLSNNRMYALEMEKNGLYVYGTSEDSPFGENCVPKPNEKQVDKQKVLMASYRTAGTLPRLNVIDRDISIVSVEKDKKTKKNEFADQWYFSTGSDDPYTVIIDNSGNIVLKNAKGSESVANLYRA